MTTTGRGIDHECRVSALLNGTMGDDGVMRCAHGYAWPPGTVLRTEYGNYVVGETEPARDERASFLAWGKIPEDEKRDERPRWRVRSVIQHDSTGHLPPWRMWEVRSPRGEVVERSSVWWYALARACQRADAWRNR